MKNFCSKKDLGLIKVYYFLLFGAMGFKLPFLALYLDRLGISAEVIGLFISIDAVVALVVSPVLGSYIGRSSNPARLLQIGLVASGVVFGIVGLSQSVLALGILAGLYSLFFAGVFPASISTAQMIVENAQGDDGFGSVRLFGSLGWAIVTFIAGFIVEQFGMPVIFIGHGLFVVVSAVLIGCINIPAERQSELEGEAAPKMSAVLMGLLKDRALVGFGLAVLFFFAANLGIRQFEGLFLDHLGAEESLIGLAFTIPALIEIPFMLLADKIILKINTTNTLRLAFVLYLFRMGLVFFFPVVPMVMVGRGMMGVAYAFYVIASVEFLRERAPEGYNLTLQALFVVTLPNLVNIVGSAPVGRLFDLQGGTVIYRLGLIGITVALLVFLATVRGRRSKI